MTESMGAVKAEAAIIALSAARRNRKSAQTSWLSKNMGAKGRHYQPIDEMRQVVGKAGFLLESKAESSMVCPREIHFVTTATLNADNASVSLH